MPPEIENNENVELEGQEIEGQQADVEQVEEDLSLRQSLEKAIGDSEEDDFENAGESFEQPEKKETKKPEAGKQPDEQKRPEGDEKKAEGEEDDKPLKAPQSWKPKSRELWSKVPKELQQQIHERESHVNEVMRLSAQAKQTHDFIGGLANNYATVMAAEGVKNPLHAIEGLFKTVAELRMGSPEQKAVKMAQMIKHYGVDINALDSALVGEQPQPSQNSEIEHLINQRMAPVNQLLEQLQTRQHQSQQQATQAAEKEVANFKGEFLQDVRMDMADLIDMAAARGQRMSLQEAYDKAVAMRPELQEIMNERKKMNDIEEQKKRMSNKRRASSSIASKGLQPTSGDTELSLRDTIAQAWDGQEERSI